MIVFIVIVILVAVAGLIYFLFPPIQVIGDSMYPTYFDQEVIFGRRIFLKSRIQRGDILVYRSPSDGKIVIKRVESVIKDHRNIPYFYCLGDNSEHSYDSRDYGLVPSKNLVCRVINQRLRVYIDSDKGGNDNDE